jgi:hypothetical protein
MGTKIVLPAAIVLSLSAVLAWAQPQANQLELMAQLEPMLEKCDWKIKTLSGGPKLVMLLHQAKMRRILAELKAGKSVDTKELEEVMKVHPS